MATMRSGLKGTLLDDDRNFPLNEDLTFLRFLRQKKGNAEKGLALLEKCIEWRRERKPHRITFDEVKAWPETGIVVISEKTKEGVPVVYVTPKSNLTVAAEIRVNFQIWYFEELARRGYRESVTVMDFSQLSSLPSGEEDRARTLGDEMRSQYYPLFDSKVLLVNMPMFLRVVFGIMTAFMSEAQKATLVTGLKPKHLVDWIDPQELPEALGGKRQFPASPAGGHDILSSFPKSITA